MSRISSLALLALLGCASKPALGEGVSAVEVTRVAPDGTREAVTVDAEAFLRCLDAARSVPLDRVAKAVLEEGVYDVQLEGGGGARSLEVFNSRNFSVGSDRYYESDCVYDLLKPAS